MTAITTIDTRGLSCPQPLLMVNSYITAKDTSPLHIIVDNEASFENITRAARKHEWKVEVEDIENNVQRIVLVL